LILVPHFFHLVIDYFGSFIILSLDCLLLFLFQKNQSLPNVLNAFDFLLDGFGQIKLLIVYGLLFSYLKFFEFADCLFIKLKSASSFLSWGLSYALRYVKVALYHFVAINGQGNQTDLIEYIVAVDMIGSQGKFYKQ
jgi:hypothetical protein